MNLSLLATVLWVAGFVLNAALVFVLLYKRRYKTVPWFTAWISAECLYTITLFLAYRFASKHVYAVLYWSTSFLDIVLQTAVVLEIARSVLRRSGRWVEGARVRLSLMGAIAPLIAFAMAWSMTPAAETRLDEWAARGSLFTTILICLLFSGVMTASQQLGLGWQSYVMRESYGLILWTLVAFATDTLHAYWRTMEHFTLLEHVRMICFLASLIYWAIVFWLPEPEPTPITSAMIARLNALKSRLDFGEADAVSSSADGVLPK